jgi:hypothetical protein
MIKTWFRDHPTANIGLRSGVGFDVIDLDSKEAVAALDQARADGELITGPVVKIAKGFHFYVLPTGTGNRAGILPGVDFLGHGGYVLGGPSIHPDGA